MPRFELVLAEYLDAEESLEEGADLEERDAARASYRSAAAGLVEAMIASDRLGVLSTRG